MYASYIFPPIRLDSAFLRPFILAPASCFFFMLAERGQRKRSIGMIEREEERERERVGERRHEQRLRKYERRIEREKAILLQVGPTHAALLCYSNVVRATSFAHEGERGREDHGLVLCQMSRRRCPQSYRIPRISRICPRSPPAPGNISG